jgi:hypothetical protein
LLKPDNIERHHWQVGGVSVEYGSKAASDFANSLNSDTGFEQLLRVALSHQASSSTAAAQRNGHAALKRSPITQDIELRAYHIYIDRGATDGSDLDDWLQAERQILEVLKREKASLRLALAFGLVKSTAAR